MSSLVNEQKRNRIIEAAEVFVKSELGNDATGHDWWHIHRVVQMAKRIAAEEAADIFIVRLLLWSMMWRTRSSMIRRKQDSSK